MRTRPNRLNPNAKAGTHWWLPGTACINALAAALAAYMLVPLAYAMEPPNHAGGQAVSPGGTAMQAPAASAQGVWNFVMKTPVGDRKVTFKFAVEGTVLKGTMTDDDGTSEIFKGSVEGNTLKWSAKVSKPMSMTLDFTGAINGDAITGSAKGLLGSAKFSGQRT